jgi:hypothetical protein
LQRISSTDANFDKNKPLESSSLSKSFSGLNNAIIDEQKKE